MTKTARDLRSAAHALRTAANALDETVTALRALSDDLNEPDPEPEPVWPTAPLVWWDGTVWVRVEGGNYDGPSDYWSAVHLNSTVDSVRDGARRFAREAVPAVVVPAAEWEAWRKAAGRGEWSRTEADLIRATDVLGMGE